MKLFLITFITILLNINKLVYAQGLYEGENVEIGAQVWMKNNLSVSHFTNGDKIAQATTDADWSDAYSNKKPVWCYYDFDSINGDKYGKIYNYYAISDPRGLAPKGYKIPSDNDWTTLTTNLKGTKEIGRPMKIANMQGWDFKLGGAKHECYGAFDGKNDNTWFWSSTDGMTTDTINGKTYESWDVLVRTFSIGNEAGYRVSSQRSFCPQNGLYVRCIKK